MFHEARTGINTSYQLHFDYTIFKNILSNFYTKKDINNITYYLDELNHVVAREEDNVLNLYFNHIDSLNNNIPISMVVIKDFILKMGMLTHKKSDIIVTGGLKYDVFNIDGLIDGYNMFSHLNKMKIKTGFDDYLAIDPDVILKVINSVDYYSEEEMDLILRKLHGIKEQLEAMKKMQIGGISTIDHNINPNDKHLSLFKIPGYSLELYDYVAFNDQPCNMLGQSYYVLNEEIKPSTNATITENYLNHHNYAKLFKPTIKRV